MLRTELIKFTYVMSLNFAIIIGVCKLTWNWAQENPGQDMLAQGVPFQLSEVKIF